jgi:hypothetical protein
VSYRRDLKVGLAYWASLTTTRGREHCERLGRRAIEGQDPPLGRHGYLALGTCASTLAGWEMKFKNPFPRLAFGPVLATLARGNGMAGA